MTTDTIIALGIIGLFYLAVIVLTVILARRAPKAEHMAKPWAGNMILGIVCMAIITGIFIPLAIKDRAPWWTALFIVAFDLLGVSLIVSYYNCRLWVADTCLIQQDFWGRKKEWRYCDVVKIVEQGYEVIFWFRDTEKWLIYARDPKGEDPMLASILEKIPEGQLDPDLPEPPIRLFSNAVYGGAGGYYAIWGIVYLLALPFLLMGMVGAVVDRDPDRPRPCGGLDGVHRAGRPLRQARPRLREVGQYCSALLERRVLAPIRIGVCGGDGAAVQEIIGGVTSSKEYKRIQRRRI